MWNQFRHKQSPIRRALIQFWIGIAGIYIGLFHIIPAHEGIGNLWTILWAVAAGAFYSKYVRMKKQGNPV